MRLLFLALLLAGCAASPAPVLSDAEVRAQFDRDLQQSQRISRPQPPPLGPDPHYIPPPSSDAAAQAARAARARKQAERDAETVRQQDYCRDLSHSVFIRSAPLSELLAARIMGSSARMNQYYDDCMDNFARADRYLRR